MAKKKGHGKRAKRARHKLGKGAQACALCHEDDPKRRHFVVMVDGKREMNARICRMCCAVLMILLTDPRRRRNPHG